MKLKFKKLLYNYPFAFAYVSDVLEMFSTYIFQKVFAIMRKNIMYMWTVEWIVS